MSPQGKNCNTTFMTASTMLVATLFPRRLHDAGVTLGGWLREIKRRVEEACVVIGSLWRDKHSFYLSNNL
ncbi:unnamed protein product [Lathyrus sativus]|nr:unnamed protein product [Lathyrus sativus]